MGVAVLLTMFAGACSSQEEGKLTASDPTFAGLDAVVVQEVLANPVAKQGVAGDASDATRARYQGMVRNFSACRAALSVYQEWSRTGVAPVFPKQAAPLNPSPWAADMDADIKRFKTELTSGDISLLRDALTNESGCGAWIPAKSGDISGPTISDVVRGKV